jgi:predicted transcriptional regulator
MAKTVPLSHRLDPELKAELQRLADADRRSLTNYIEVVLEDHVAKAKGKRK